jgi:hypothetical protein
VDRPPIPRRIHPAALPRTLPSSLHHDADQTKPVLCVADTPSFSLPISAETYSSGHTSLPSSCLTRTNRRRSFSSRSSAYRRFLDCSSLSHANLIRDVLAQRPFAGPKDVAQAKEQFEYHQEELETTTERLSGTPCNHDQRYYSSAPVSLSVNWRRSAREDDRTDP